MGPGWTYSLERAPTRTHYLLIDIEAPDGKNIVSIQIYGTLVPTLTAMGVGMVLRHVRNSNNCPSKTNSERPSETSRLNS